eukprot:Skav226916  [mRNA]  locus=scaffold1147:36750:43108:+ [translate_table: standard]
MMCLLDEIYVAQHGRPQEAIVKLSGELVDELWMLVCLAPLAVTDLRAGSMESVFLSDASEEMKASVNAPVPLVFARELQRHCISKGAWTRLLSPWKVWLKQHFDLDEESELPEGVPLVSHPLWLILAQVLRFGVHHRRRAGDRRHINVLELESLLEMEEKISRSHPDSRYLAGSDSQVAIAALLKGRSSSWALNRKLQGSLAHLLGDGLYGSYGYVPSLANVSDDPTRLCDVREPSREVPGWLEKAFSGDFAEMDRWLAERGYDPLSLAQLPFPPEIPEDKSVMLGSFLPELRAVQKPERLEVFDKKVYGEGASGNFEQELDVSVHAVPKVFNEERAETEGSLDQENIKKGPPGKMNRGQGCLVEPKGALADLSAENKAALDSALFLDPDCAKHGREPCTGFTQSATPSDLPHFGVSVESSGVQLLGSEVVGDEKSKRPQESEDQTKRTEKKLSGKMNREKMSHSVASPGEPQPKSKPSNATGSSEPPRSGAPPVPPWSAAENLASPLLSSAAVEALRSLPSECFICPGGRRLRRGDAVPFCRRGFLDLYSGKSAVARSLARRFHVWVITVDFEHGSDQNLLDATVQQKLHALVELEALLGVGAAPECCSFSRAVCPAVRSAEFPEGLANLTANMTRKVAVGNQHAAFLLALLKAVLHKGLPYWVENPDGSFLWLLKGWISAELGSPSSSFRFDMCRYSTPWRKRTRIATNTVLRGMRCLCLGGHSHTVLRGRNRLKKMSWTRLAQVYPRKMAYDLASAMGYAAGLVGKLPKLNITACARCQHARIGEASNPGPRAPRRVPRDLQELEMLQLVEPVTMALQQRVWRDFEAWLEAKLTSTARAEMMLCPPLVVEVLRNYGMHLFSSGHGLYSFGVNVVNRPKIMETSIVQKWAVDLGCNLFIIGSALLAAISGLDLVEDMLTCGLKLPTPKTLTNSGYESWFATFLNALSLNSSGRTFAHWAVATCGIYELGGILFVMGSVP